MGWVLLEKSLGWGSYLGSQCASPAVPTSLRRTVSRPGRHRLTGPESESPCRSGVSRGTELLGREGSWVTEKGCPLRKFPNRTEVLRNILVGSGVGSPGEQVGKEEGRKSTPLRPLEGLCKGRLCRRRMSVVIPTLPKQTLTRGPSFYNL